MSALAFSLIAVAMGSSPEIVVLPVRTAAITSDRAAAIADRVAQVLQDEGVALTAMPSGAVKALRAQGAGEPSDCGGNLACVAKLGGKLGAGLVVGVGAGEFEGSVALHLEVLSVQPAERSFAEDQLLPSDLRDPLWARALAPFARRLLERRGAGPPPPARVAGPPPPPSAMSPPGDWVVALQVDSGFDALGGMVTLRAGRQLLPVLSVSAGALVTGAAVAGATVQARATPFAGEWMVHPVVALEVPVLIRASPAVGVRPSLGVEVRPLPWLTLSASASYLRLLGVAGEIKPGYWLGGAEVGLRL